MGRAMFKSAAFGWQLAVVSLVILLASSFSFGQQQKPGENIVNSRCAICHATGVAGAPIIGNKEQWSERLKLGLDLVVSNAVVGIRGMPPKGGNPAYTTEQIRNAVIFMIGDVNLPDNGDAVKAIVKAKSDVPKVKPSNSSNNASAVSKTDKITKPATKSSSNVVSKAEKPTKPSVKVASVNSFSRLMKPRSSRNPPPISDGIHDPDNPAITLLQKPKESFSQLSKGTSGNYVDWVAALENGEISPRYDRDDPARKPLVMDLNIIREVKGSMPDVIYPHKQHTEWLDCSNCHPAIFEPKKGANAISMAGIILGEKCGVCHGKVAFPVSDCRRCHARKEKASIRDVTQK